MNRRKIIFSILKEIEKGEQEPKHADYDITYEQFGDIVEMMQNDKLIEGASFAKGVGKISIVWLNTAKITMKGLDYLDENNIWSKTYKGLKEIREWLPL